MTRILVATADGLHTVGDAPAVSLAGRDVGALGHDDGLRVSSSEAPARPAPEAAVDPPDERWWAVVDERVVLRAAPGMGWEQAAVADTRLTCLVASRHGVFAGTVGAHLRRLVDGALEPVVSFDEVPGRDEWYTPWGGPPTTRSLSAHPDGTLYANVHVGGVVRSRHGGRSWEPTVDIDVDVHEVRAEPRTGWVVAATGAGAFAVSEDGGDSWRFSDEGLHGGYCRAVAVAGATVLLSASRGPRTRQAAVYRRPLEGDGPFQRCREGLPEWFAGNIDTGWLDAAGDVAVLASPAGELYLSQDAGGSWQQVAEGLPPVRAVAVEAA